MWQRILWFLIKHVFVPLFIYMVVTSFAISNGVDATIANIIGGACGFGTVIISIKFP
jgi:hypothetical protein